MIYSIVIFIIWLILGVLMLVDKPYPKTQNEWRRQYFIVWILLMTYLLMTYLLERIII